MIDDLKLAWSFLRHRRATAVTALLGSILRDLPGAWPRLDALEGSEYHRMLAPFITDAGVAAVGYLYAATADG